LLNFRQIRIFGGEIAPHSPPASTPLIYAVKI